MTGTVCRIVGAIGLASMLAMAGQAGAQTTAADPAIVKLVPPEIAKGGVLAVGTDATYAPFESVDPTSHQIVGFDADIAQGIAALMGLKLQLVNSSFDSLIPSIASGKFNLAMSSIGDTKEREAVVDFVTYYWNSTSLLVPKDNPKHLSMDQVCGARVGVERGSLQQNTMLPMLMAKCPDKTPALETGSVFRSNTDAVLALSSGRIDAVLNDAVATEYAADKSNGQFVVVGPMLHNKTPGGIAIRKESGLQQAVLAAVQKLMADGTYAASLKKWDLAPIAISDPVLDWNKSH